MHDFVPPSAIPQMPSYTPTPAPQTHPPSDHSSDRARAYKSRNKRPCDFCRFKKAACHLDNQPPCELCLRYNKECTFVESPAKRRRPNESSNSDSSHGKRNSMSEFQHDRNGSFSSAGPFGKAAMSASLDMQHELLGWDNGVQAFSMPSLHVGAGLVGPDFGPFDPALYQDPPPPMGFDAFEPISAPAHMPPMDMRRPPQQSSMEAEFSPESQSASLPVSLSLPFDSTSGEPSLDLQDSSNCRIVGTSGEMDPYLLSRYRFDQHNEAAVQSIRMRKMNDTSEANSRIPSFMAISHNALSAKAHPSERAESMDKYRRELEDMVNDQLGRRLIHLFYKFVQPYFPILRDADSSVSGQEDTIRDPRRMPTCLLAAIYGHALPFCAWDEKLCVEVYTPPSADALFRVAWFACLPLFHNPSLAVLQALLLLVQRRPTNKHVSDTPFKGVMMNSAVSMAQSLGLHRDPSEWALPSWEIKLRRRLAWATYVQDKWLALNSGRSSHIQAEDWDVGILTDDDLQPSKHVIDGKEASGQHFVRLAELTAIVSDILRDLFSIRATKVLQNDIDATLEAAKPLRLRLTDWYQSIPPGLLPRPSSESPGNGYRKAAMHELDGNGSLHLAYITAKIELFRAMLRPRVTDPSASAMSALRKGALAAGREILEFVDGLNARELEAFWASYSRTNFTIASSFMVLLYVSSPTFPDAQESLALLNAWRSLLRVKSRSCDLLNLALLRLDGIFVAGMDRLIELSPAARQAWAESEGPRN